MSDESLWSRDAIVDSGPAEGLADWWDREQARRTIAALRAVLAPLLDDPWIAGDTIPACCVFCGAAPEPLVHAPDCPVLRRDALLGR